MVHYGGLTGFESFIMGSLVILSNMCGLPAVYSLSRRKGFEFQFINSVFMFLTSTMYHMCQVLDYDLYMSQKQWHRLDNVFAISGVSIFILHLSGNGHARKTLYSTYVVSILTQEKDPWNIRYTIAPLAFYQVTSVILRIYYWKKVQVKYNFNRLILSIILLVVGGQFFVNGLQQKNDYLRFNHHMWHVFVTISYYYGMNCTSCQNTQHIIEGNREVTQGKDGQAKHNITGQYQILQDEQQFQSTQ